MENQTQLLQQIKKHSFLMFKGWALYLIITGLVIGVGKLVYNIPVDHLTKEPNRILHGPFYVGAFSNLGIILWTIAATLCIVSAVYLKRYIPDSPLRLFLLHIGIFTTVLMLDDVYMWHDAMLPYYFGIDGRFVYAAYFIYTLYFIVRFRKVILKTDYIILLASVFLMSLSVLCDTLEDMGTYNNALLKLTGLSPAGLGQFAVLFEDTFKGLGIITWLIYFSRVTFTNVLPSVKNSEIENSKRNAVSLAIAQEKMNAELDKGI